MLIFIESATFGVGAGFIPARSNILAGLRAGINPAPTRKGDYPNWKVAHIILAITSGIRYRRFLSEH
jgi:hypothetical protein